MFFENILTEKERQEIADAFDNSDLRVVDYQAEGTLCIRQPEFLKKYLHKLKREIEIKSGFKLKETYTGIRVYRKGDSLERHVDNASEYAITIVVKQSDNKDNPLIFYPEGETVVVNLKEGEGYSFKGMEIEHERPEVQSNYLLHIYLGYTIQGEFSESLI